MGATAGKEIEDKIKKVIKKENIKINKIKTQKLGNKVFAELNINLPSKIKVDEAEIITKNLQKKLIDEVKELEYVAIQIKSHDVNRGFYKVRQEAITA